MKSIWKYKLDIANYQTIPILEPAKILSVSSQGNQIVLYAEVNTDNMEKMYSLKIIDIWIHGTGHEVKAPKNSRFIGTVKLMGGTLMFHVYVV